MPEFCIKTSEYTISLIYDNQQASQNWEIFCDIIEKQYLDFDICTL